MTEPTSPFILTMATQIVAAFVGRNPTRPEDLPGLIRITCRSLCDVAYPLPATPLAEPTKPAVPIAKSVTNDFLICLESGKRFKSLKRHLSAAYGLSPDEYRAKWGLPADYPMVAPGYSAIRSGLAKEFGLGHRVSA